MERNREARRATVAAVNGGGLSRRRQHRLRESLEEDGGSEMQEMSRLRERQGKNDRDRSGRSKRRRAERAMHDEEEDKDSSSDSVDEEDEDDDDPPLPNPGSAASASASHNHHKRNFNFPAKRPPPKAAAAEDRAGLGLFIPRRARTSSGKRSQEMFSGGGGDPMHQQQASTSPARPVSPSSSSASVRKKVKPTTGTKHRPPKKSSASEDLQIDEIEVAEVLFGLTRQQFHSPPVPETEKAEFKDATEAKYKISSPASIPGSSQSPTPVPASAVVPKRKRPRLENPSASSTAKVELEPAVETEVSSPRLAKKKASPSVENRNGSIPIDLDKSSANPENIPSSELNLLTGGSDSQSRAEGKEEIVKHANENRGIDLDFTRGSATKDGLVVESSREVKFSIDLMAPPPGKSSMETEGMSDFFTNWKAPVASDTVVKTDLVKGEEGEVGKKAKQVAGEEVEARKSENSTPLDLDVKKIEKDRSLDLQLDFNLSNAGQVRNLKAAKNEPKPEEVGKQQSQKPQQKAAKIEPKPEHAAHPASLPVSVPVGGWPGSFPPFGYMGQAPPLQPGFSMDRSSGSSKTPPNFLNSQLRPKRCATHCYIAHKTQYHQQLSRMNPYWPAAPGAAPVPGGKQYNLNSVPPSDSTILGTPSQAKTPGTVQDKVGSSIPTHTGHSKEKSPAGNTLLESAQSKQLVLQQAPQPGVAANMLHGPTFLFPLSQQHAAAATTAATVRSGASKSALGAGNAATAASSSSSTSSALAGPGLVGAASMNFNYPGMPPNEAQYMALLQNGAYPFPIPANVGAPPSYRANSAQAMLPFLNGSFYSPQLLHPPQLQQHPQQQHPQQQLLSQQPSHSHVQQGHQNPSTSSGSSSSQRPQQRPPVGAAAATMGTSHSFPALKKKQPHLPTQGETGSDESPTTASSKASQAQKNMYNYNMAMAGQPQNFTLISPAAATLGSGGGSHTEKQQQPPQLQPMKVELTTSQAFAMSFGSFGGAAAATSTPLQGFDFTSMAQNHALFQGLPEAAMKGYQMSAAAPAAAGTNQVTQHKKPHHHGSEDGKSAGERMNASATGEEERKMMTTSKSPASAQHSLSFSRPNSDTPVPNIHGNSVLDSSSRTLNLIKTPGGGRVSSRSASVAPTTSSSTTPATLVLNTQQLQQQVQQQQHHQQQQQQHQQQQQQQFMQLQMQQRHLQMQHQLVNRTKTSTPNLYTDQIPAGSAMSKFPQALAGFPQGLIQGGGATQSPQWKTSTRGSAPAATVSSPSSATKNQQPQQQGRGMQQQAFLPPGHPTHISFGVNSSKASAPTGQQHLGSSNASISQSSVSKNASGSPRASSGAMAGPSQATMLPHHQQQQQQQQPGKHSPSSSTQKSSPMRNSNAPSILGQSNMAPAPNTSSKQQQQPQSQQQQQLQQQQQQLQQQQQQIQQQQQHHHLQKQQQIPPQAQFFFSNAYVPAQASHPNAASTGGFYHQNRQPEQQTQQHVSQQQAQQNTSATTSEQAKAAAASNVKVAASPGLLQHQAQFAAMTQSASGTPHTLMSAMAASGGFPYPHTMHSVPPKPAEQKPAAGNDNLNASWQPEKR